MVWTTSSIVPYDIIDADAILRKIEYACRTCYQSYDKTGEGSAERLIRNCIQRGHESILEHVSLTFTVVCDRAVLAQWTRHRMASYAVESQRYCNYGLDKFDRRVSFIRPVWAEEMWKWTPPYTDEQLQRMQMFYTLQEQFLQSERNYFELIRLGAKPEEARALLPNAVKCTMIWTANMREIRHFIKLRANKAADPSIRKLAYQLYQTFIDSGLSVLVEDLEVVNV